MIPSLPGLLKLFSVHGPAKSSIMMRKPFVGGLLRSSSKSGVQIRMFASTRYIEQLEHEANNRPTDSYAQLRFLSELNKANHHQLVIQRFESGYFSNNENTAKEYVKALVASGKIDQYSMNGLAHSLNGLPSEFQAAIPSISRVSQNAASDGQPVQVQLVEPNVKTQMWRTFRFLALTALLFSFVGNFVDLNVNKQLGITSEFAPQIGTNKTFEDVKGASEAKEELKEIVHYLRNPAKFTRLGGKLPKGVLLTGPPGTGKTLLAKAIAGEAGVPFFYASGSEFEEMYVGVGARRIRELFEAARKNAPCIVFIDEIDAIGSTRALKETQAMKMTLNQLLVELDGFKEAEGIIIVGATNFPDILDPALVRPGRFDRNVVVPLPDLREREEILSLYLSKVPHEKGLNKMKLARGCPGLSGADLSNLVNIAALRASTHEKNFVSNEDLEYAKDKILMGGERKSAVIPEEVRKVTAWHESGHALVAFFTQGAMPLHKATVLPRGPALGMVVQLPEENDLLQRTKKQMIAEIDVCMGGRVAEELVFGEDMITSGASSDIEKATRIAEAMVKKYGMNEKVGVVHFSDKRQSKEADDEVRKLLMDSYERVKKLMTQRRVELGRLANSLLENETLSADQIEAVFKGKEIKLPKLKEEEESETIFIPPSLKPSVVFSKTKGSDKEELQ